MASLGPEATRRASLVTPLLIVGIANASFWLGFVIGRVA